MLVFVHVKADRFCRYRAINVPEDLKVASLLEEFKYPQVLQAVTTYRVTHPKTGCVYTLDHPDSVCVLALPDASIKICMEMSDDEFKRIDPLASDY